MSFIRLRYMISKFEDDGTFIPDSSQYGMISITPGDIVDDPTNPIWPRVGTLIAEDLHQQRQPLPGMQPLNPHGPKPVISLKDLDK